jgi:prolipoprotein diacylglyceryltransferase
LVLVAVSRIFEEIIRVDEKGIAGTPLTVAQWISVFGIMIAAAIFAVQSARNRDRTWLMPSASLAKPNSGKPNSVSSK